MTAAKAAVVFLLDVDNTLLDHDELKRRVSAWVAARPERLASERFWHHYEAVRAETGIVNFLEAARQFGAALGSPRLGFDMRCFLWDYPFRELMFPGVIDALTRLRELGSLVVLCDGHERFQRRKLDILGVAPYLDGVLVFAHKEAHVAAVLNSFPASTYVMIDDKPRILRAVKASLGDRVLTVQVRHGHYANASEQLFEEADFTIDSLGASDQLEGLATQLRALR